MAKKIKFALKMKDGVEVRNLQELQENFDLNQVTAYFLDGRLETWLSDRYYDEEVEQIVKLKKEDPELQQKLCRIFGAEYNADSMTPDEIEARNQKLIRLKEITDDEEILSHVDSVAFSQEELQALLDNGNDRVYLCGNEFVIPEGFQNKTYIGINTKIAVSPEALEHFQKNHIRLLNIEIEIKKNFEEGKSGPSANTEEGLEPELKFSDELEGKEIFSQIKKIIMPSFGQRYSVSMQEDLAARIRKVKEMISHSRDGAAGLGELYNIHTLGEKYFDVNFTDNFSNQINLNFRENIRPLSQKLSTYLDGLDEKIRADNREVLEKIKETWAAWRLVADVKKISKEELENPYYHLKPLVEYQKNFWRDMETVFDELREEIDNNAKMYSEVMTKRIQDKVLHSAMERISLFF